MSKSLACFGLLAGAATARVLKDLHVVEVPVHYSPTDGYSKVVTDVHWGTPPQKAVRTVFDAGSAGFWVDTNASFVNAQSQQTGRICSYRVDHYANVFHVNSSSSHTPLVPTTGDEEGFGYGNAKQIGASKFTNDTMQWADNFKPLHNVRVALADNTTTQDEASQCQGPDDPDVSIIGLAPGSFWRQNLLLTGHTKTLSWSIWFKKPSGPAPFTTMNGTSHIGGGPPKSAFSGPMAVLPLQHKPEYLSEYYTIDLPSLTINDNPIRRTSILPNSVGNPNTTLLDSGTTTDMIPFNSTDMVAAGVGLINYDPPNGFLYFAYNGSCEDIPEDLTFDYHFTGKGNSKATVKVPVRTYAYGPVPGMSPPLCNLAGVEVDNQGTTNFLGAPFFTAAALHFRDGEKNVGIAQGGL